MEAIAHAILVLLAIGHIIGGMATQNSGFSIAGAVLILAFVVAIEQPNASQDGLRAFANTWFKQPCILLEVSDTSTNAKR